MGIFERLGSIISSYLNDMGDELPFRKEYQRSGDSDFDAAYEELNDFLNGHRNSGFDSNTGNGNFNAGSRTSSRQVIPEELRADFECLGVAFGADEQECKTAYKNLLKIHHPDRHAGHEGNFKKATERSMKINAAWDRIEKWRKG